MKENNQIRIRKPCHIFFRNNLRKLWLSVAEKKLGYLQYIEKEIFTSSGFGADHRLDKLAFSVRREIEKVEALFDNTICMCTLCAKTNRNMIYTKHPLFKTKKWLCVKCAGDI